MIFAGVDAGGTKTQFVLCDEKGKILAEHRCGTGGFFSVGVSGIKNLVREGLEAVCQSAGITREDITFSGLGFPGYGEKPGSEREITAACEEAAGSKNVKCECDCYLGWAGSLAMKPGINIVSGTGSICYGINEAGEAARSSGWGAFCDEGSCSWIGRKLIEAYTKQADGRWPRTMLYTTFREHFRIEDDIRFIHTLNHEIAQSGREVAKLQLLVKELSDAKDEIAERIYLEAAAELSLSVRATADKLGILHTGYQVSYSGGLFYAGGRILEPLKEEVRKNNGTLAAPQHSPEQGALLMAMRQVVPDMDFTNFVFN